MALSKIDVANMLTGVTPVANGGTAATTLAGAGLAKRPNAKPLIINGDMMVAQRGTSTASITGSDVFVVDRWRLDEGADSTITMSQETLSSGNAFDNGFLKSLKVLFTTADSSLASNQSVQLMQHVEAQDCQLFKYGTSNAVDLTLAFWYKSNVTGTHVVTLDKPDSTRTTCPVEFTVSSSGTWEHKVLNFNANDTIKGSSGAIVNDNGTGLRIMWNLLYGSDYTSGTNGSWTQGGVGHFSTSNQQNIGGSNNNYVEVTGVQLEVGQFTSSTLPPFQHESFEENLARCHRYCYVMGASANAEDQGQITIGSGLCRSSGSAIFTDICGTYPQPFRTLPSVTQVGGDLADLFCFKDDGTSANPTSISVGRNTISLILTNNMGTSSGLSAGDATFQQCVENDTDLVFDAEL